jgi:Rod binding domain-containing protein
MSSIDFSLTALSPLPQIDPASSANGGNDATRIKQVSKALESVFTSQLMAEMGKGIDSDGDDDKEGGQYSDFIQQAMTQGMSQGGGLGLAKTIENYLNHRNETATGHMPLKTPNNSYHVNRAD